MKGEVMARYKPYTYDQKTLIPIDFKEQILPGTFEYALNHIIDKEFDLSIFDTRYKNDETGAPAYNPAIMLKIILYAYSKGIIHSRKIERCCREHVIFKALSANTQPHFTTIADFISSIDKETIILFRNALLICDEMGLIGKNMFAIDGCKLSSNASKEWSGTREDFEKKKDKIEKAIEYIVEKHRSGDKFEEVFAGMKEEEEKSIEKLRSKAAKLKKWLSENEDRPGKRGNIKKSNITDNESAKMPTSHGVVQGYNGLATVDSKHQIIVHAEAHGELSENDLLGPMLKGARENFQSISKEENIYEETSITADSGFHNEKNMEMLEKEEIDGYVADPLYRKRDPRFATAARHKNGINKKKRIYKPKYYTPKDFSYDKATGVCVCPAGKELWLKSKNFVSSNGFTGVVFMGRVRDCRACKLRSKCLRNPKTEARQVAFLNGVTKEKQDNFTQRMIKKLDSVKGRYIYSKRMGVVEPVFANICSTIGLNKFTLRGRKKVTIQWTLYCILHNIGKMYRYGPQMA